MNVGCHIKGQCDFGHSEAKGDMQSAAVPLSVPGLPPVKGQVHKPSAPHSPGAS